ncbi:hypothetical protein BJ165DRAFT_1524964 [Panaeolus papilionaceus]|nr:hypothetical protein BJ165DRAFT_1524964 [Panaeolus papilionaceus]
MSSSLRPPSTASCDPCTLFDPYSLDMILSTDVFSRLLSPSVPRPITFATPACAMTLCMAHMHALLRVTSALFMPVSAPYVVRSLYDYRPMPIEFFPAPFVTWLSFMIRLHLCGLPPICSTHMPRALSTILRAVAILRKPVEAVVVGLSPTD